MTFTFTEFATLVILMFIIYLFVHAIVDRICRCVERCFELDLECMREEAKFYENIEQED